MNYRNHEKRKIMKITVGELCEKLDILNSLEKMKMTESMQVYIPKAYPWNHAVGPHGNMGNISPFFVSLDCNKYGITYLIMYHLFVLLNFATNMIFHGIPMGGLIAVGSRYIANRMNYGIRL